MQGHGLRYILYAHILGPKFGSSGERDPRPGVKGDGKIKSAAVIRQVKVQFRRPVTPVIVPVIKGRRAHLLFLVVKDPALPGL